MTQLGGRCIGGPYDGRDYANYGQIFHVAFQNQPGDSPTEARCGTYRWDDGEWRWSE
jgi:hypothetical protein